MLAGESIAKLATLAPSAHALARGVTDGATANGTPANEAVHGARSDGPPSNGAVPTSASDGAPLGPRSSGGAPPSTNGVSTDGHAPPVHDAFQAPRPAPGQRPMPGPANGAPNGGDRGGACTAPQLRRFIKSRPYVPMHELRRRFGIDGTDDDVTGVAMADQRIYVGLPEREGSLLGELLRGGEIGYELSLDPRTPIVIGVYPMRPVPRS